MTRSRLLACGLAAVLVGTLSACASNGGVLRAGNRILLTHPDATASGLALISGRLAVNAKGCETLGDAVLVVPAGSTVAADGSIDVDGVTLRFGTVTSLGGGFGHPPAGSPCGSHARYFWH